MEVHLILNLDEEILSSIKMITDLWKTNIQDLSINISIVLLEAKDL